MGAGSSAAIIVSTTASILSLAVEPTRPGSRRLVTISKQRTKLQIVHTLLGHDPRPPHLGFCEFGVLIVIQSLTGIVAVASVAGGATSGTVDFTAVTAAERFARVGLVPGSSGNSAMIAPTRVPQSTGLPEPYPHESAHKSLRPAQTESQARSEMRRRKT